jgi:hypothetical protein
MLTAADVAVVQHSDQGTMDQAQGDGGRELAGDPQLPQLSLCRSQITDTSRRRWCDRQNETFIRNGVVCVRGQ